MTTRPKNPIKKYSKILRNKSIEKDVRVWCSVIISTACRMTETRTYKVIKTSKDTVTLKLTTLKKSGKLAKNKSRLRHKPIRTITIDISLFNLKPKDYIECEGHFGDMVHKKKDDFRSGHSYRRRFKELFGKAPRDYRVELATYMMRKGMDRSFIRDLLCHENLSTTDHYIETNQIDHTELSKL